MLLTREPALWYSVNVKKIIKSMKKKIIKIAGGSDLQIVPTVMMSYLFFDDSVVITFDDGTVLSRDKAVDFKGNLLKQGDEVFVYDGDIISIKELSDTELWAEQKDRVIVFSVLIALAVGLCWWMMF